MRSAARRVLRALTVVAALAAPAAGARAGDAPARLEPWTKGTLDVHQISTGRGNAALVVFPDGTTLLFDAGDAGGGIPLATALPNDSRGAGEWVARYVARVTGGNVLDYAVVSHFHPDHVGGLGKVVEDLRIGKLIDRGYPDYGEPAAPKGAVFDAYRRAAEEAAKKGSVRERARVGRADQIVPVRAPGEAKEFEVRVVAANGEAWTGTGDATARRFPDLARVPAEDQPSENPCSVALLIRYGGFALYTGGDLYGMPEPGAPAWWDLETPIASAIGRTDVMVVNHHGSIEPASPFFLATLAPRVIVVPAWAPTHPSPDVLKRLLSKRIWPGPRDVFVTRLRDATKAAIGPRAAQVASDAGRVVVRVAPGGGSYRVFVVDDTNESGAVKSVHGPYASHGAR
jgi:beta-lactamase superfamily II metal-dependent hydrolase